MRELQDPPPPQQQEKQKMKKVSTCGAGVVQMVQVDMRELARQLQAKHACSAEDFALLCVLLGNDFVPRLPCLSIGEGGIEMLLELRRAALADSHGSAKLAVTSAANIASPGAECIHNNVKHTNKNIVCTTADDPEGTVLLQPLLAIMENLALREDGLMVEAEARHKAESQRARDHHRHHQHHGRQGGDGGDSMPLLTPFPDVVQCHLPGWRPRYHRHVLAVTSSSVGGGRVLDEVCRCYLQGWVWSFRYTHQRCLSFSWYYPLTAAPTATDMFNHMSFRHANDATTADIESALLKQVGALSAATTASSTSATMRRLQCLQLMMVLPPQSSRLLEPYRCHSPASRLMHDVTRGFAHLYPSSFTLNTYLKHVAWECHPILPQIDMEALAEALAPSASTEDEYDPDDGEDL
jgi:5'-3' exonuclease